MSVEDAKAAGNAAFKAGDNEEAVRCFSEASAEDPTNHVLYSNRSAANAKLGQYKDALLDANKCIDMKPDWSKGHSRRGAAYEGLKNWVAAISAYAAGLKCDPDSPTIKDELAVLTAKLGRGGSADGGDMPHSTPPRAAATTTG